MKEALKDGIIEWIKDIVIAAVIIAIIMGSLYAYTGIWPPMVVVESESMQHSDDTSYIGVIDTGDIVLSKRVSSGSEITTYVAGRANGYRAYGDYGDVIIYRPYGLDTTPIIHRAVVYLVWNSTGNSYDAPGLRRLRYGVDYTVTDGDQWRNIRGTITIMDYGYTHRELRIPISAIISNFERSGRLPHDGYITAGDHNIAKGRGVDQPIICREPVKVEWLVGRAEGEIPWFGIIKLIFSGTLSAHPAPANSWIMLVVFIVLLITVPMVVENIWERWKSKKEMEYGPEATEDSKDEIQGSEKYTGSSERNGGEEAQDNEDAGKYLK